MFSKQKQDRIGVHTKDITAREISLIYAARLN